jgi:hypothetical protein
VLILISILYEVEVVMELLAVVKVVAKKAVEMKHLGGTELGAMVRVLQQSIIMLLLIIPL